MFLELLLELADALALSLLYDMMILEQYGIALYMHILYGSVPSL